MTNFKILFFVVLCISQSILGESDQEKASINNIVHIVEELGSQIKLIVVDLTERFPKIVKNVEKNVKQATNSISITSIFEDIKDKIEQQISSTNTISLQCSRRAKKELDELHKQSTNGVKKCVTLVQKKTIDIKENMQHLMVNANSLGISMKEKIEKCTNNIKEDAIALSDCLQNEVEGINQMLEELRKDIKEMLDTTEEASLEAGVEVGLCLTEVKDAALKYTEHVIDEMKSCSAGDEL